MVLVRYPEVLSRPTSYNYLPSRHLKAVVASCDNIDWACTPNAIEGPSAEELRISESFRKDVTQFQIYLHSCDTSTRKCFIHFNKDSGIAGGTKGFGPEPFVVVQNELRFLRSLQLRSNKAQEHYDNIQVHPAVKPRCDGESLASSVPRKKSRLNTVKRK